VSKKYNEPQTIIISCDFAIQLVGQFKFEYAGLKRTRSQLSFAYDKPSLDQRALFE